MPDLIRAYLPPVVLAALEAAETGDARAIYALGCVCGEWDLVEHDRELLVTGIAYIRDVVYRLTDEGCAGSSWLTTP